VFSASWCLAVGVSRADGSTDTSRVAGSVDVSEGHHGGQVAEGVVGTGSSGDPSGVDSGRPLLPAGGGELLLLPDQLVGPPLTGSLRSRDKSGNISRGDWDSSLPLATVVSKLTLVSDLGSPPLGGSGGSRDKAGDVSRGDRESCLPLAKVVSKLTLVGNLGSPPLGGGRRARDESGDVARGDGKGRLTSAERYQRQRRNLAEHVETRGRLGAELGDPLL